MPRRFLSNDLDVVDQAANFRIAMAHGDKELAIMNYKKSLDLDPKNTNAVDKLKELNH